MKVTSDTLLVAPEDIAHPPVLSLPQGLVGFPEYKSFELVADPEEAPFRWMLLHGTVPLQFVVIEPAGIIADYELELFDEDAAFLGITESSDAYVVNIVTVGRTQPATATVNLVSPVVINRRTGLAKQVVLANYSRYNVRHPLVTTS